MFLCMDLYFISLFYKNFKLFSEENSDFQSQVCAVFQCILNIVEGMYFFTLLWFCLVICTGLKSGTKRELKTSSPLSGAAILPSSYFLPDIYCLFL